MIPVPLLEEHRIEAERLAQRPTSRTAAVIIVLIWIAAIGFTVWLYRR
jgi:hypothetical protein